MSIVLQILGLKSVFNTTIKPITQTTKWQYILPTGQWYAQLAVIKHAWYCMVLPGIAWYCMVLHGIAWYCMVL